MIRNRSLSKYKGLEHSACSFEAVGVQLVLAPGLPVVSTDDGERVQAFTSRPVMQLLNPLLVRYWMAKCEKIHAACKPDYSSKDFRFPFRLIDVQNGRLVEAPRDVRYVALSYVWGGVKPEGSITSEGLKEPEEEYLHIKPIIEGRVIPRTIQDAIRLCQLLDERYLWTDSLCIMQDDEFQDSNGSWTNADKMAQIPKMNLIYGASVLTIIAAHGTDSNAGLPGVHASNTRTTQTIGKIGDQIFLSIKDDPMEDFWQSKWCERAWT
ncbi:HET-domain-containing protein, partial [Delitschia confertaspora ATCC 74209]